MSRDQKMQYEYTVFIADEEKRLRMITDDILIEYPRLGVIANKIARMERPFGPGYDNFSTFSDPENHINRLINIIIVTENKEEFKEEYTKACNDLENNFKVWLHLFPDAKFQKHPVYLVMQSYFAHQSNNNYPIMTFSQAITEVQRRNVEDNINKSADNLRSLIPELGEFADQVAVIESNYNRLDNSVKEISNLIIAFNLLEGQSKYQELCQKIVNILTNKFNLWLENYGDNVDYINVKNILIDMMERLNRHLNGEDIKVLTYYELCKNIETNDMILLRHQS